MRVALIATHHAEYAANLAWALANDDDVLLVLSARNAARQLHPDTLARLRTRLPVTIVPHHYAPLQPLVAALCLRAVAAFRPDVVHIQEHPSRAPAWVAQALRGRYPLVTTVHDPLPHTGADTRAAASFVRSFARLRSSSDALIVHGAALVAQLAATEPDGTERVRVAPHGVLRCGRLADGPTPSSAPGRGLLMFGRMNAYKGLDVLLAAARRWGGGVPVTVVGAGAELDRLAPALRAAGVTVTTGRVPQDALAALVTRHAAALLPYQDATGSGVAATALGLGRPVIATRVGALAETVRDGVDGLLIPPGDAEALAAGGAALAGDPNLAERLAAGARAAADGPLGWRAVAATTRAIYQDVTRAR